VCFFLLLSDQLVAGVSSDKQMNSSYKVRGLLGTWHV
jgi:hypothetical protein